MPIFICPIRCNHLEYSTILIEKSLKYPRSCYSSTAMSLSTIVKLMFPCYCLHTELWGTYSQTIWYRKLMVPPQCAVALLKLSVFLLLPPTKKHPAAIFLILKQCRSLSICSISPNLYREQCTSGPFDVDERSQQHCCSQREYNIIVAVRQCSRVAYYLNLFLLKTLLSSINHGYSGRQIFTEHLSSVFKLLQGCSMTTASASSHRNPRALHQ